MGNKIYFKRSACCTVFCVLCPGGSCPQVHVIWLRRCLMERQMVHRWITQVLTWSRRFISCCQSGRRVQAVIKQLFLFTCSGLKRCGDRKHILELQGLISGWFWGYFSFNKQRDWSSGSHWTIFPSETRSDSVSLLMFSFVSKLSSD